MNEKEIIRNPARSHPFKKKQERQTERNSLQSALFVSLTDIIEDMFPGMSAEDKHRIAVTKDAIPDHQTGSEQDEGHQHENQNPHHC